MSDRLSKRREISCPGLFVSPQYYVSYSVAEGGEDENIKDER